MRQDKTMSPGRRAKKRQARIFQAFLLASLSCALGLVFCMVKSPQARSEAYRGLAAQAMFERRIDDAAAAAMEAVRLNPAAPEGWTLLSELLRRNGQGHAAQQALAIASRLQNNPETIAPVYALPAELRLSLLALAETGGP